MSSCHLLLKVWSFGLPQSFFSKSCCTLRWKMLALAKGTLFHDKQD